MPEIWFLLREDVYGDGRFWKKSLVSGLLLVFDLIHMQEVSEGPKTANKLELNCANLGKFWMKSGAVCLVRSFEIFESYLYSKTNLNKVKVSRAGQNGALQRVRNISGFSFGLSHGSFA